MPKMLLCAPTRQRGEQLRPQFEAQGWEVELWCADEEKSTNPFAHQQIELEITEDEAASFTEADWKKLSTLKVSIKGENHL